jgi:hypothetical protein
MPADTQTALGALAIIGLLILFGIISLGAFVHWITH